MIKKQSFKDSLSYCITAEKTSAMVQSSQGSVQGRVGTQIPKPTPTQTEKKIDMRQLGPLGGLHSSVKEHF